jgi:hypothetical protein
VVTNDRRPIEWILLSYSLPREPSTPRIAVWRRLRHLGVAQVSAGLVALPLDARNREQLEWIADEALEHDGTAAIWIGVLASASDERRIVVELASTIAGEYRRIIDDARAAHSLASTPRRRTLARLRRELRRVRRRDYFPPPEREQAAREVAELGVLVGNP